MRKLRAIAGWAGYLIFLDLLSGLLLLAATPETIKRGLPGGLALEGHPYKAYAMKPSDLESESAVATMWKKGAPELRSVIDGIPYDFGMFEQGIFFDAYSHGVFKEDLGLYRTKKEKDEIRVLFLGGSTTFQPWPFFVAEALSSKSGLKVKAINAGTGGYTSQENVVDLMLTGFEYSPDLVVAYLPANDIYHAARWPGFKRDYSHFRSSFYTIESGAKVSKPVAEFVSYPFSLRVIQILRYNSRLKAYTESVRIDAATSKEPHPDKLGIVIDDNSYQGTLRALEDNIFDIKTLCKSRDVPFLLVTQKLFEVKGPVVELLDGKILEAVAYIRASPRLADLPVLDLQALIPQDWNQASRELMAAAFPGKQIDTALPLFYDSMHFSPPALYLVAAHVAQKIGELWLERWRASPGPGEHSRTGN